MDPIITEVKWKSGRRQVEIPPERSTGGTLVADSVKSPNDGANDNQNDSDTENPSLELQSGVMYTGGPRDNAMMRDALRMVITGSEKPKPESESETEAEAEAEPIPETSWIANPYSIPIRSNPPTADVYPQCYKKEKRLVYIMNHFDYNDGYQGRRDGSKKDVKDLKVTLNNFNVTIQEQHNQTKQKILDMAKEEARKDYAGFDFVMYIIMTHGDSRQVLAARDDSYNLETDFINVILKNKQLIDVPKVFIIQACRGSYESDANMISKKPNNPSDILKLFSTYEGFESLRDTQNGTVFIQELCSKLDEFGTTEDLMVIMRRVTTEVVKIAPTPEQSSTLRKALHLGRIKGY